MVCVINALKKPFKYFIDINLFLIKIFALSTAFVFTAFFFVRFLENILSFGVKGMIGYFFAFQLCLFTSIICFNYFIKEFNKN